MKFKITRSIFLDTLQRVQSVVGARNTLQILSNALIRAEDGALQLTTTDLDISVRCSVNAEILEGGATTLPIRHLVNIVRELPEDTIEIEINNENIASVSCGSSFFKIIGLPANDFPPVPVVAPETSCFKIDGGTFKEMLRKTSYAVSLDETRRVLTGLLLSFKDGKLTVVATDGRRLALVEHEVEFTPESEIEVVLPKKSVNELQHILRDDAQLSIYMQKGQAIFVAGDALLSTKLIDGVYPNYRQVIPSGYDERVVVMREELLTAMRRVSLVTTEKANSTQLTFADNRLTIGTAATEIGEAHASVPIKYNGQEISVIFNPEFVIDPLRNLDNDEIYIELSNGHSPALIKCDLPFLYVLMPVRIN